MKMCSSTPAQFHGLRFDGPHSCAYWVGFTATHTLRLANIIQFIRENMATGESGSLRMVHASRRIWGVRTGTRHSAQQISLKYTLSSSIEFSFTSTLCRNSSQMVLVDDELCQFSYRIWGKRPTLAGRLGHVCLRILDLQFKSRRDCLRLSLVSVHIHTAFASTFSSSWNHHFSTSAKVRSSFFFPSSMSRSNRVDSAQDLLLAAQVRI